MKDFINAQEMAKEHPDTFEAPTIEELEGLKKDASVKVAIGGERFWAKIVSIDNGEIKATVDNDLLCTDEHGFKLGDTISFRKEHIYDIYPTNN